MKPYAQVLDVRPEVLSEEGILDMVDLVHATETKPAGKGRKRKRLADKTPISDALANAEAFFALTYPTDDICQTLYALARRLSDPRGAQGTILLNGRYGLGKSHILLAAHHALTDPAVAKSWAERWKLEPLELGERVRVVTRSFIQRTTENLWQVLFEAVDRQDALDAVGTYPDGSQIEAVLDDKHTVLILDELERWFDALPKQAKSRNRNFLQALTEVANRSSKITLVTSVLGEEAEPAETLRRVKPLELAFGSATDRQQVLLYRLFSNHQDRDANAVKEVVDAYVDIYRRGGVEGLDTYRQRMLETYPFTPEFLDILTKKVPNLGGFQNTRGSLRFLAKVVAATHETRPLVSSQDLPFRQSDVARDLGNLDAQGGEVVRRALGDNLDAVPSDLKHRDELFSAILFYSIADPSRPGATEKELLLAILDPGENPNEVKDALRQLRHYAFNLHLENERYVFRTQENPHARIHAVARSPQVTDDACRAIIVETLRDRWGAKDRTAVHEATAEPDETGRNLSQLGDKRPLFLLATATLSPNERLLMQNLHKRRNTVMLIEPRFRTERRANDRYELTSDRELMGHAQQIEACRRLLESKPDAESGRVYREVRDREEERLGDGIRARYGNYISWHRTGSADAAVDDSWYELGRIDEFAADGFLEHVKREYSGAPAVEARIRQVWHEYERRPARDLIDYFDSTPGQPVPYDASLVPKAIRRLASEGSFALHHRGKDFCRRHMRDLSEDDLPSAVLVPAPPETTAAGEEERPPVHLFVSAQYDAATQAVMLSWQYPERPDGAPPYQTLVQRYANSKGWEEGKLYRVDLDQTHENNRYIGTETEALDERSITPGSRYHYYVFLVDRSGDTPRTVLSKRCDVRVPQADNEPRPDEIRIPAQQGHNKLHMELEKRVMTSKYMTADSRARKIEFAVMRAQDVPLLSKHKSELEAAGGSVEANADLRFVVRGSFSRQQILSLARKLPKLSGYYTANVFLATNGIDEGGGDT